MLLNSVHAICISNYFKKRKCLQSYEYESMMIEYCGYVSPIKFFHLESINLDASERTGGVLYKTTIYLKTKGIRQILNIVGSEIQIAEIYI